MRCLTSGFVEEQHDCNQLTCGCRHRLGPANRAFVALLLLLAICVQVGAGEAKGYPLDKEGFIRDWLIAGPYPNPQAEPEPKGFAQDLLKHLGGEANVIPYAGMADQAVFAVDKAKLIAGVGSVNDWGFSKTRTFPVKWEPLHWKGDDPIISLDGRFGEIRDWLAAFAACWVESSNERDVHLRVGSDDGYKLYLNHELIGAFTTSRAAAKDQNIHLAKLRPGLNLILLKITDRTGGHAFCLRITDPKGRPYDDLRVVLEHPMRKFAAICSNVDQVDVVDREGFARIRLAAEPRFPGTLPFSVKVGLREAKDCRGVVLITDGQDRPVFTKEFRTRLTPEKAMAIEGSVRIDSPGPATVAVLIQDPANRRTLAHLSRRFEVLSEKAVRMERATLQRRLAKREKRRKALAKDLAQKRKQLAAIREKVAGQYREVESLYARRREALAKRFGKRARSIDVAFAPAASPREVVSLNGDGWEIAAAAAKRGKPIGDARPPAKGWEPAWAPMMGLERYFRSRFFPARGKGNIHYGPTQAMKCAPKGWTLSDARIGWGLWYRTTLDVPQRWAGRRLVVTAEYAGPSIRAFLDGKPCERVTGGWPGPTRIDLPPVSPGPHVLAVLAQRTESGGHYKSWIFGLMGDVSLTAVSDVAVADTWVITSWRNAEIEARVWLLNRGAKTRNVTLDCQIVLGGRTRFRMGEQRVELRPGLLTEVRVKQRWTDPKPWGIGGKYGDPVLYHLVSTVREGDAVLDQHFTRFGFREFWTEGFHFYLNGKRIFIQGSNPNLQITSRPFQVIFQHLLRDTCNVNAVRTHFDFPQGMIADVADELGMLVLPQWYPQLHLPGRPKKGRGGPHQLSLEEFLTTDLHRENLRQYAAWVKWLRNHPSVAIYCTDNEIFTQAWDTPELLETNIRNDRLGAVYGRFVKALDPTRLVTRDGDQGTWGKLGKWQEDPPAEIANYHYPDFNTPKLVDNWESLYEKPALFGETLYAAYGAWDGWIGAVPQQVAAKAQRCRRVLSLYRGLEVPGWVGMGPAHDCFIELKPDGSGNPWGVTEGMLARYKADEFLPEMPRYPYFPIEWPSLSGPGFKPEFHRFTPYAGWRAINAYFADRKVCVLNAVNVAYKQSTHPMPALSRSRPVEALITATDKGRPLSRAVVVLTPKSAQACPATAVRADKSGRAWFVLNESGRYEVSVEGKEKRTLLDIPQIPFESKAGFGYLPRFSVEVGE